MKLTLFLILLVSSISIMANETREYVSINHTDGDEIDISLVSYLNESNTLEVRIEGAFFGPKLNSLNPILGYGRDLDFNGKIDSWFIFDENTGMQVIQIEGKKSLGQDILGRKVFLNEKANVLYRRSVIAGIFRHIFLAAGNGLEAYIEFHRKTVDLEEFKIRLKNDQSRSLPILTEEQLSWSYYLLIKGYEEAHAEFKKAMGRDYLMLTAVDVALWGSGGYFAKWGIKGARFLQKSVTQMLNKTSAYKSFTTFANSRMSYLNSQAVKFQSKLAKLKLSRPMSKVALTKAFLKSSMKAAMLSLSVKHRITHKVLRTLGNAGLEGIRSWKYVSLVGVSSAISETYNSYDSLKDDDPVQTAKNVFDSPEIMKNVEYMSMQTFLGTAAASTVKSTPAKFGICGFVALGHSGVRNMLLADDPDYKRVAFDSGWEVMVGSTQTVFDLKAINYFEKLAVKNGNPRLKLLGYAIVFVEQVAGSYIYARTTNPKPDNITVVPVFASN